MLYNFHELGIDTAGRTGGRIKTLCPQCHDRRRDKRDRSLSVDLDTGLYHCHYCDWSGCAADGSGRSNNSRASADPLVGGRQPRAATSFGGTTPYRATPSSDGIVPSAESAIPLVVRSGDTPLSEQQLIWFADKRQIPADVLKHFQITASLQKMPPAGQPQSCICFNYYEQGELVNTKFRTLDKHFKMVAEARQIPYNIDAIRNTEECIITEGEIDALSFAAAGRWDVISVPNGANRNLTWLDRFVESHFDNKRVIYIASDTDVKGGELCHELLRRFGAERCRIVSYGPDCKDANELLVKAGPEALLQALADAPLQPLDGVFTVADVAEEMHAIFMGGGLSRGADTGLEDFDRLCTFELRRLCVVTGYPGDGKSEFVDELSLRLCIRHGWKIGYFSPENLPLSYHMCKLMEKITGSRFKQGVTSQPLYDAGMKFLAENVTSILPEDNFTVDSILRRARELVSRRGIRILVIDPFNRLEHQIPPGQTETQYISAFLDKLSHFAIRNQCLVILVAHPTKMQRDFGARKNAVLTLQNINGSAAFANKADFGMVVERDQVAGLARIHVLKVKFKHLGKTGVTPFVYNITNGRYSPCHEQPDAAEPGDRVSDTRYDSRPWIGNEEEISEKDNGF